MPKCKYKRNVLKYNVSNYLQEAEKDETYFQFLENTEKSQTQSFRVYLYMGINSFLKIWSHLDNNKWIWWYDGWDLWVICFIIIPIKWIKNAEALNISHNSFSKTKGKWECIDFLMNFKFHRWELFRIKILGEHALWYFYKAVRYGS